MIDLSAVLAAIFYVHVFHGEITNELPVAKVIIFLSIIATVDLGVTIIWEVLLSLI